ncbi:MAG: glycine betaine ABC transporter substrate-binding protein [Nitriliruptorales bacterium]|nr:glycine betaine ABC transporter substrate-binding protein [Nitriliruptorales bacterium]
MTSRVFVAALAVLLGAAGCVSAGTMAEPTPSPSVQVPLVRVGTSSDPESRLLAAIQAELLEAAGMSATVEEFRDNRDARQALELGDIDVRPAYTGEAWLEVLGRADPPGDPLTSYLRVRDHDQEQGITWLRPSFGRGDTSHDTPPANATFAFVVRGPPGRYADLQDMTDLATRLAEEPDAEVCVDPEFADRPDGLSQVWDVYGVADRPVLGVPPADAVLAVSRGACIAGLTTTTDGMAWSLGLKPLVDDLEIFPAFVVAPQIRDVLREERPQVVAALAPMPGQLTTELLGRWNARVVGGETIEEVAADAARTLLELAGRPAPESSPSPTG